MSRHENSVLLLLFLFLMSPFIACIMAIPNDSNNLNSSDHSITTLTWDSEFKDVSIVSDFPPWPNTQKSWMARIAIDSQDHLHMVWADQTSNITGWGLDFEILYSTFDDNSWSIPIAISDQNPWNGTSEQPSIAIDSKDNLHIVWSDDSPDPTWNTVGEYEILYRFYNDTSNAWSPIICISDDGSWWNTGDSKLPFIAIDNNDDLHVTWHDYTGGQPWGGGFADSEILYINQINGVWGSVFPVSDDNTNFNTDLSEFAAITVDSNDNLHIVWQDDQDNLTSWLVDREILYRNFTIGVGWGSIIGLSGVGLNSWNNDTSEFPIIATDPNTDTLHIVWVDDTNGIWGTDIEIFYSNSTNGMTWSNATALSGVGVNVWNTAGSYGPWITVDNLSVIHVAWHDDTDSLSEWGSDREIFYSNSTNGATWLNATCLSDQPDHAKDNDGLSEEPCIAYDSQNFVHIVWYDNSINYDWSPDYDILYTTDYVPPPTINGGPPPPIPWWIWIIIILILLLLVVLYLYNRHRKKKKRAA